MKSLDTPRRGKEFTIPVRAASEFHNFISNLWNMFDAPSENGIDISESSNAINVAADLPGMDENDIEVQLSTDGYLSITGEKKQQIDHNKEDSYFSEISYGMFRRTVYLPWDLDYSKAQAEYSDGTLNIEIPKIASDENKGIKNSSPETSPAAENEKKADTFRQAKTAADASAGKKEKMPKAKSAGRKNAAKSSTKQ